MNETRRVAEYNLAGIGFAAAVAGAPEYDFFDCLIAAGDVVEFSLDALIVFPDERIASLRNVVFFHDAPNGAVVCSVLERGDGADRELAVVTAGEVGGVPLLVNRTCSPEAKLILRVRAIEGGPYRLNGARVHPVIVRETTD